MLGVYVWRKPKNAFSPQCVLPTVKNSGVSVMVWAAISWESFTRLQCIHCFVMIFQYSRMIRPSNTLNKFKSGLINTRITPSMASTMTISEPI
uniref:Uncharacterized protein n=1 Tax=Esox lucius TaxID=8010 RepID=A0A3P8ZVN0_ESOLU